jgi:hypothetical protein
VNPDVTNSTPVQPDADEPHTGEPATDDTGHDAPSAWAPDPGEEELGRGRCWAVVRRDRVPLFVTARRQYEAVLTDRRLLLLARSKHQRRRLGLKPDGVALAQDLDGLHLQRTRAGFPLRQLRIVLLDGRTLILEFDPARRALADRIADRLPAA